MKHESLSRYSDVKVWVTRYLLVNKSTQRPFVIITRAWYRLRDKAGIEGLCIHDLCHRFASFLVNSGRSLYEVQLCAVCPFVYQGTAGSSERGLVDREAAAGDMKKDLASGGVQLLGVKFVAEY